MYITKIRLKNFRNYKEQEIDFHENINIIYGNNGEGKTNIIEAIFMCALGKSFRTNKEKEIIKFQEKEASIEIEYKKSDRYGNVKIEFEDKKNFYLNKVKLKKTSEILGNIFVVLFSPEDIGILKESPGKRRRFLNIMISQLRPNYVHILNLYNKTLEQRNAYLRQVKYENKKEDLLDIWDEKLADLCEKIFFYRKEFIDKISNKINNIHSKITSNKENIEIKYIYNCKNKKEYIDKLRQTRDLDIQRGYTNIGIHRDDFGIYINNIPVNIYGSQGQQRTVMISLKVTELEVIYEEVGEYPIFLLDDFMSELDKIRINNLLENITNKQVIITCTDKMAINQLESHYYKVENGKVL